MSQAPKHPGTIVYVDGVTQKETRRVASSQVPESMRFVSTPEGLVPVVRVVTSTSPDGNRCTIREYGPAGEFLRSTVQLKHG